MTNIKIYNLDIFLKNILEISEKKLIKTLNNKKRSYSEYKIPKKNGYRTIYALKGGSLSNLQSNLKKNFLDNIPIADNVYGFVEGYGYKDFLTPHTYKKYYLRLDIKNFFESIKTNELEIIFDYYITASNDEEKDKILDYLMSIISLNDYLPQGAITSPATSNIFFRELDIRIQKYCKKLGFDYSRYADDILISSDSDKLPKDFVIKAVNKIVSDRKLKLNYKKTIREKNEISLNGFVVGKGIRLSRNRRYDISKINFLFKSNKSIPQYKFVELLNDAKGGFKYRYKNNNGKFFSDIDDLINYLAGYRSFLINWIPDEDNKYYNKHINLLNDIEEILLWLN